MSNPPKRAKTTKTPGYIPEDIKLQILQNLPVKSLLRFKCVSKTWRSQINNPTFISTHINLTISSPNKNPLLLLRSYSNRTEHYSLRLDDENLTHYMHFLCPFKSHNLKHSPYFHVVGTINGLICLTSRDNHTIIIWNPLIQKSVSLPKPSITISYNDDMFGFGYDSSSSDYKLLRLVKISRSRKEDGDQDEYKDDIQAEVYSLNMNTWRRIGVPRYEIKFSGKQVFVNGVLHFLASRRVSGVKFHNLILGFDVGDEVFKKIMLPPSLVNQWPPYLKVSVCDELVAVFEEHLLVPGGGRHVWVMEQYGVVQSWAKIFSYNGLDSVLAFRKNRDLFLQTYAYEIVSLKPEYNTTKYFGVRGGGGFDFVDYFVESMELLNNANAVSDANVENDAPGDAAND